MCSGEIEIFLSKEIVTADVLETHDLQDKLVTVWLIY
jgi:hypothetical protein